MVFGLNYGHMLCEDCWESHPQSAGGRNLKHPPSVATWKHWVGNYKKRKRDEHEAPQEENTEATGS